MPLPVLAALVVLLVAGGIGLALSGGASPRPATKLWRTSRSARLPPARVRQGPEQQPAGQRHCRRARSPRTTGRMSMQISLRARRRHTRLFHGRVLFQYRPDLPAAQSQACSTGLVRNEGGKVLLFANETGMRDAGRGDRLLDDDGCAPRRTPGRSRRCAPSAIAGTDFRARHFSRPASPGVSMSQPGRSNMERQHAAALHRLSARASADDATCAYLPRARGTACCVRSRSSRCLTLTRAQRRRPPARAMTPPGSRPSSTPRASSHL